MSLFIMRVCVCKNWSNLALYCQSSETWTSFEQIKRLFFRVQSERLLWKWVSCLFLFSFSLESFNDIITDYCFALYFSVAFVFWVKKRKCLYLVLSCHLSFVNLPVFYWWRLSDTVWVKYDIKYITCMDSVIIGILWKNNYYTALSWRLKLFCCKEWKIVKCKSFRILLKCTKC